METEEQNPPTALASKRIDSPDSSLTFRPGTKSGITSSSESRNASPERFRPSLSTQLGSETIGFIDEPTTNATTPLQNEQSPRLKLQSRATTALSLEGASRQTENSNPKDGLIASFSRNFLQREPRARSSFSQLASQKGSETGDSASVASYAHNSEDQDEESIFGDLIAAVAPQEKSLKAVTKMLYAWKDVDENFADEFDPVGELDSDAANEETLLERWKAKRKHYLILSAAGKPIYTRHGDGGLVSSYIGIIQTIISLYREGDDMLKNFVAGNTKFVIISRGPLYLVAISRLLESEYHLSQQLDALYMQVLSTLTLPTLTHLFSVRPSTDLKRPLQGTETLLSSLADSFTKGSPVTLLSALECLKIRKAHRQVINNALLKTRVDGLLYGLVVAGGRLVSVIRPKKHSLHPGDLQLLFNMIFEADGVKAGGGESWIPVCLPGFNSSGYLYMYVNFIDLRGDSANPGEDIPKDESVAIILISTHKESFFRLQEMQNALIEQLDKTNSLGIIKESIEKGRPSVTDIVPGSVLHHFIYKSKAHVQFVMSSFEPEFVSIPQRRRLMSIYNTLHDSVHARHTHIKVQHGVSKTADSFTWVTPIFELYCVAGPNVNRKALAQSANKILQWIHKEEERLFIISGAVF